MYPKLNKSLAVGLLDMLNTGASCSKSKMQGPMVNVLEERGILISKIKGKGHEYILNKEYLINFLSNVLKIESLENYINTLDNPGDRAQNTLVSGDSKLTKSKVGQGFLIKSFEPLQCFIAGKQIVIQPENEISTFIHDVDDFKLSSDIVIVGIENFENFRKIHLMKDFFSDKKCVFISRHLNKGKSLQNWLSNNNNEYIHFGDFDLAGIHIYLNEIKPYIKGKASFYMPANIEKLFVKYGNQSRFNNQASRYNHKDFLKHPEVAELYKLIIKYKAGIDQEILLTNS